MVEVFANSGDPDQTPRSVASDQGLHCLPITLLESPDYNVLTAGKRKGSRRHSEIFFLVFLRKIDVRYQTLTCSCSLIQAL